MSFLSELRRRNVFRVGAAYLVVAWLVLQIVDTVGPMLSLPDVFGRSVLLLVAIGFPVVLVGSWVFELTPEGLRTQAAADESGYRTSATRLNAVVIGGLALALTLVVLDAYVRSNRNRNRILIPHYSRSRSVPQKMLRHPGKPSPFFRSSTILRIRNRSISPTV